MNNYNNPQNEDKNRFSFFQRNQSSVKIVAVIALAVLTLLIIIGACVGCYYAGRKAQYLDNINAELPIANEVYTLIKKYYYKDITKEQFEEWASIGLANTMDQFSGLSYSSTLPSMQFGFSFKSDSYNNHIISEVSEGSPAKLAGLQRGDILLSVDDKSVVGLNKDVMNTADFFGKGAVQTVKIKVKKSDGSEKEYNVKKSFFNSKEASYIDFGDGVGYIKLNSFTGTAAEDFVSCADAFKKNGNSKLILDLRDNGGGSTNILSVIASYLIHYGDKDESNGLEIIRLKSEKTQETISYTAEGNNWLGKGMNGNFKLAVLVNENSASASEALLGAIKYYCGNDVNRYKDELVVIGSPTYGKGIAQQTFELTTTKDYVLSMTVGYFYVPIVENGKQDWKTFHGVSMNTTEGYEIEKFSSFIDFKQESEGKSTYLNYYNNNIKSEKAVEMALNALK